MTVSGRTHKRLIYRKETPSSEDLSGFDLVITEILLLWRDKSIVKIHGIRITESVCKHLYYVGKQVNYL